jgi:hypothetical protein
MGLWGQSLGANAYGTFLGSSLEDAGRNGRSARAQSRARSAAATPRVRPMMYGIPGTDRAAGVEGTVLLPTPL